MNDNQLIAAIKDILARAAAIGLPIATMRNSHVGHALIIPSAPADFSIPRGFFIEEEVPTGPMVGGFPTFRSAGLNDILDLTSADHKMMDEIGFRMQAILDRHHAVEAQARAKARKLAVDGMSVSDAIAAAAEEFGISPFYAAIEFRHREIRKNRVKAEPL